MKISNEYWYKYSQKGVGESPHRQCVVRPAGLFLYNGLTVTRSEILEGKHSKEIIATEVLNGTKQNNFNGKKSMTSNVATQREDNKSHKFQIENYYSRLETPANEEEELRKRMFHEQQVQKIKHLYHDDNYVRHSSSLQQPKREENSNLYLTDCQRLWVPSHHRTRYVKNMWEKQVCMPEDVAYKQVMKTLQRDRHAFSPTKTTTAMDGNGMLVSRQSTG